jgi:hypothetical protein
LYEKWRKLVPAGDLLEVEEKKVDPGPSFFVVSVVREKVRGPVPVSSVVDSVFFMYVLLLDTGPSFDPALEVELVELKVRE